MFVLKTNHDCYFQPSFVLEGRVMGIYLQTYQKILFMSPVCIVYYLKKYQIESRCEVFLTLKNEIMRSCITVIQNDDSGRNIFLHFKTFFTNDAFEKIAFFVFFWMLKIRIFGGLFFLR